MTEVRFKQVDVFTDRPFLGNPVAVVLDPADLTDEEMQRIAAWTNLSETTFVLPSDRADYGLRIFTPRRELPFAGHPTVGSAHAVIEAGLATPRDGALTQECIAGIIELRVDDTGRIAARVPPPKLLRDAQVDAAAVSKALGAPLDATATPTPVDVGPVWLVVRVESAAALAEAQPDLAAIERLSHDLDVTGVTAFAIDAAGESGGRVKVRSFAPTEGVPEDPVCGSGNASVGAYLGATGLLAQTGAAYVASQGREMGRDGRIHVAALAADHVEIGGDSVTVIEGAMRLR